MIKNIRLKASKLDDKKLYSINDIMEKEIILDTSLKPSRFTIYRLIQRGDLPSVKIGNDKSPRYFVKGSDLKKFVHERYRNV